MGAAMIRIAAIASVLALLAVAGLPAAQVERSGAGSLPAGQEWCYTGTATRSSRTEQPGVSVVEPPPTRYRLAAAAAVARQDGRLQLLQRRQVLGPQGAGPAVAPPANPALLWIDDPAQPVPGQPSPLRSPWWLAESFRLPIPFHVDLKEGAEAQIGGWPPYAFARAPVMLRLRVTGREPVNSASGGGARNCWRVEASIADEAEKRTLSLAEYREVFWLEAGSGAVIRYEGLSVRRFPTFGGAPNSVTEQRFTATLELQQVAQLTEADLRRCRAACEQFHAVAEQLAVPLGAPDLADRLQRAEAALQRFRSLPAEPTVTAAAQFLGHRLQNLRSLSETRERQQRQLALGGQPAPALALRDLEGKERRLEEFRGKVVVLCLFASWCPICNGEAPKLEREIWQKYRDRGVVVVGIDSGEQREPLEPARKFRDRHRLTFPILVDAKSEGVKFEVKDPSGTLHQVDTGAAAAAFRVYDFPALVLLDPQGKIVTIDTGDNLAVVEQMLEVMLKNLEVKESAVSRRIADYLMAGRIEEAVREAERRAREEPGDAALQRRLAQEQHLRDFSAFPRETVFMALITNGLMSIDAPSRPSVRYNGRFLAILQLGEWMVSDGELPRG
jgi:peroxiredoxin